MPSEKDNHETLNDETLKKAFNDYFDRILADAPPDDELAKKYAYPESSIKKVRRRYKAIKNLRSFWLQQLGRVAMIVLITLSLIFGVLMTNSNVRAAVSEFFIKDNDTHLEINYKNDEETTVSTNNMPSKKQNDTTLENFEITYIPYRYKLEEVTSGENYRTYLYRNPKGHSIYISILPKKSSSIKIYNDVTLHNIILINGQEAVYSYKKEEQVEDLILGYDEYIIHIITEKTEDEAKNIAKGIVIKK